jgi:hypothetical protein
MTVARLITWADILARFWDYALIPLISRAQLPVAVLLLLPLFGVAAILPDDGREAAQEMRWAGRGKRGHVQAGLGADDIADGQAEARDLIRGGRPAIDLNMMSPREEANISVV